jgi:hypothetical protein
MDGGQDQLLRDQGAGRFDGVPLGSGSLDRGLISRLTKRYSGNPHDTKHIRVKGTRHDLTVECYYPKNAADIQTDTLFHSQNEPNQWLYYDFRKMRVTAAHYFLRSHRYPVDSYHLRSWVIEASGDKINWTEIDRRENGNCLNGPSHSCVFAIPSVIETRLIRLRSIGPDCAGTNWLIICAFELFGGLRLLDSAEQL